MLKIGFIFILTFYAELTFGQKWKSIPLSDRIKVEFPKEPEIHDTLNIKMFHVVEAGYVINVAVSPMPAHVKFDSKQDDIAVFYKRAIEGRLYAAMNSKVLKEKRIEIDGLEAREVIYTKDFNGRTGMLVSSRVLLVDRVLFILDVWDLEGKGQVKLTNRFFKSIKVL